MAENICEICRKPAQQKCSGCHSVFYCSKEHQKAGWKNHKKLCRAYKIGEDELVGRHLVATRPIKEGEIVLQESPLVWGPSQNTVPVCLGCGNKLIQEKVVPCDKCGWPMCSQDCKNSPSHVPECFYTVNRGEKVGITVFGVTHPTYECITVLRCLYQKQFFPKIWEKLKNLQSHCEERKQNGKYENDKATIVRLITKFLKLDAFEEEEILKVCGIVMVNGHEVPLTDPPHVALYETTSMFEHNCKANCTKSFSSKGGVVITAGTTIQKGDHLSICYTDPLWGTSNRRQHLFESKFFWCSCKRCSDPSEFGTNFNSIKCPDRSCKGYMLPNSFISDNLAEDWHCYVCKCEQPGKTVIEDLEQIGIELSDLPKGNSEACKLFIKKYEKYLHPYHYYLTDIKFALSQLIGQEHHGGLPNVSDEDLELKAKLCQTIEELVKKIAPAERRLRGLLLFELHAAVAEIGRRRASNGVVGPEELQMSLLESKRYLMETVDLLKYEPEELPEGKIYKQSKLNLQDIDVLLRNVYKSIGAAPI